MRAWLARGRIPAADADELIQEAYCRLAMLREVDHIDSPYAYFHSIVRNLLLRRLKRQQVISFEAIAEIDAFEDDRPSPEQIAAGKLAYRKLLVLIADLPERCRRVVELRKIEGWSQKQISDHLGITEKAVAKQIWLGLKLIRAAWRVAEEQADTEMSVAEQIARGLG